MDEIDQEADKGDEGDHKVKRIPRTKRAKSRRIIGEASQDRHLEGLLLTYRKLPFVSGEPHLFVLIEMGDRERDRKRDNAVTKLESSS